MWTIEMRANSDENIRQGCYSAHSMGRDNLDPEMTDAPVPWVPEPAVCGS